MVAVYLPEEVIGEILLRLPVKSLLKFRCVSKSWLSLISTHQFTMAHLNISSKRNQRLIFGSNDYINWNVKNLYTCSISSVSELTTDILYSENPVYHELDCPPFINEIDGLRLIVGSCNGLVCLSFKGNDIVLWNPALKKFKKLPYSSTHFNGYGRIISLGFGYDKVHDDYKVSVFSNSQLKVYSTRLNSWKVLGNWPGGDACCWPGQFLNGAIHWCVLNLGSPKWIIVAQNVVSDEFVKLPLPTPTLGDFGGLVKVEILDGCVALCYWYKTYMDLWMMKEYGLGESWIKQFCIPYSPDFYWPQPFLFFGDGKILIKCGRALRIYDSTNPQPLSRINIEYGEATVTTYFESLVSPNLDNLDEADVCAKVK